MGHLTSRFGKVSPQGRVIGWAISSIAVALKESSPIVGLERAELDCTRTKRSHRARQVRIQEKWLFFQRHKVALNALLKGFKMLY